MTEWTNQTVRDLERASLLSFVESCAAVFDEARVLDYGCGKQPYRGVVEAAGGEYVAYDRIDFPANVSEADIGPPDPFGGLAPAWDVVLCNQVIQYVRQPVVEFLTKLRWGTFAGGALVLTGPTNWAEVESHDLNRYTLAGIVDVLHQAGYTIERAERRGVIDLNGFKLSVGFGVVARA